VKSLADLPGAKGLRDFGRGLGLPVEYLNSTPGVADVANEKDIALLGTEIDGAVIGDRLLAAGHRLTVWNRHPDKTSRLQQQGADVAATAVEAVGGAEFVLTNLDDGAAVREVMTLEDGALEGMGRESVWLETSTKAPEDVDEFDRRAKAHGVHFVDASVVGFGSLCAEGPVLMVAGSRRVIGRCEPLLEAFSRVTRLDEIGEPTRLGLVGRAWAIDLLGAVAETTATAEALGVDVRRFFEAITGGAERSSDVQRWSEAMRREAFAPRMPLRAALKDARLIDAVAQRFGFEPPIVAAVAGRLARAFEQGHGEKDMSALFLAMRPPT
jgi:3-hydroxyisobutyrate dehydrogenase